MTEKELREIKRRFRPERSNIPRIVGCFVNRNKEIIANISQPIEFSDSIVSEKLLGVMKKTLSGTLGTNLYDISFSSKQVLQSEEHALLMKLRDSSLKDGEALAAFFAAVNESVTFEGNYVILLANDVYDVFEKRDESEESGSSEQFSYVICAICPVKCGTEGLSFREADSLFHLDGADLRLCSPELGFMFPAFDDRKTNIYGALYYSRSVADNRPEFVSRIFGNEPPIPPKSQASAFNLCLKESLGEECGLETVRSIHSQLSELVEEHRESKNPEPLVVTKATVKSVLANCGIAQDKVERMGEAMDESFGINAPLSPKNIVNVKKFELTTPDVTIKVNPEHRELVTTEVINGVRYIMIRATEGVEVNGINIEFEGNEEK